MATNEILCVGLLRGVPGSPVDSASPWQVETLTLSTA